MTRSSPADASPGDADAPQPDAGSRTGESAYDAAAGEDTSFHLIGFPQTHDTEGLRAREPFEVLASQFVDQLRQGEKPSVERFARRYPPHAARIRECFPVLAILEQARISRETETFRLNMPGKFPFKRLGRCDLLCELGRGGMGVVFQAKDSVSGHIVAIKVLPWRVSIVPAWQQRFEKEARTAAQLRHTNIVPVFRFGQQHGYCYFVMKFVNGVGLDLIIERLRQADSVTCNEEIRKMESSRPAGFVVPDKTRRSPSAGSVHKSSESLQRNSWNAFASLAIQTTQALRCAHGSGILHNDIKPGNLLLDRDGHVWVTDFGVAQPFSDIPKDVDQNIAGTLRFMSPERVRGTPHDVRSDLYSLGVTLYELCTQQAAFESADRDKLLHAILEQGVIEPRKITPSMPRDLQTIILNCMQRRPEDRYATADALLTDLLKFTRGLRIHSTRQSPLSSLLQSIRRPRAEGP